MRTTKELLEIMLENIGKLNTGLCRLVRQLQSERIITHEEANHLLNYIFKNKPFNLTTIMSDSFYYWDCGKQKPRRRWLKRHIRQNKF
jgi:hypothetical protein